MHGFTSIFELLNFELMEQCMGGCLGEREGYLVLDFSFTVTHVLLLI